MKHIKQYAHSSGTSRISFSPSGKHLFTIGQNGVLRKFTPSKPDEPVTVELDEEDDDSMGLIAIDDTNVLVYTKDTVVSYDTAQSAQGEHRQVVFRVPEGIETVNVVNGWCTINDRAGKSRKLEVGKWENVEVGDESDYEEGTRNKAQTHLCRINGDTVEIVRLSSKQTEATWKISPPAIYDFDEVNDQSKNATDITASCVAWSSFDRYLSVGTGSGLVLVYDLTSLKMIKGLRFEGNIVQIEWNPENNDLSLSDTSGAIHFISDLVDKEYSLTPFRPNDTDSVENKDGQESGHKLTELEELRAELKLLDEDEKNRNAIDMDDVIDENNWIVDDDNLGYVDNEKAGKRPHSPDPDYGDGAGRDSKRVFVPSTRFGQPELLKPFQQGASEWKNNRRYLTINTVGYVWTVTDDFTVSFFDTSSFREYHFQSDSTYDLASLSSVGCFFADTEKGELMYRFNGQGTRGSWTHDFDPATHGKISTIVTSTTRAQVTTSKGFVFYFTTSGILLRVTQQNCGSVIAAVADSSDNIMTIRQNQSGTLSYSIENTITNEFLQKNDSLPSNSIRNAFFSEEGDPCICDETNVVSTLTPWRVMFQASWHPIHRVDDTNKNLLPIGITSNSEEEDEESAKILAINQVFPISHVSHFELAPPHGEISEPVVAFVNAVVQHELAKDRPSGTYNNAYTFTQDESLLRILHTALVNMDFQRSKHAIELLQNDESLVAAEKVIELAAPVGAQSERAIGWIRRRREQLQEDDNMELE